MIFDTADIVIPNCLATSAGVMPCFSISSKVIWVRNLDTDTLRLPPFNSSTDISSLMHASEMICLICFRPSISANWRETFWSASWSKFSTKSPLQSARSSAISFSLDSRMDDTCDRPPLNVSGHILPVEAVCLTLPHRLQIFDTLQRHVLPKGQTIQEHIASPAIHIQPFLWQTHSRTSVFFQCFNRRVLARRRLRWMNRTSSSK